jgi:hypothetical protein
MAYREAKKFPVTMATLISKLKTGEVFKAPARPNYLEAEIFPKAVVLVK